MVTHGPRLLVLARVRSRLCWLGDLADGQPRSLSPRYVELRRSPTGWRHYLSWLTAPPCLAG